MLAVIYIKLKAMLSLPCAMTILSHFSTASTQTEIPGTRGGWLLDRLDLRYVPEDALICTACESAWIIGDSYECQIQYAGKQGLM